MKHFPKEIGTPTRRICYDMKQFINLFKQMTGKYDKLYFSLYNRGKNGEETHYPLIHLTAFDIDNDNSKYENVCKMHNQLKEMNLKHCVSFSTNGFWIYILNKNYENLMFPRDALFNSHDWFAEQFGLKWGNAHDDDLDVSIRGDVSRISRLIGSYDVERKRYCYSLTEEDLQLGMEHIIKKSENHQSININWFGNELFDISLFDKPNETLKFQSSSSYNRINVDVPFKEYDFSDRQVPPFIRNFMPIVQNWLVQEGGTPFKERYWATVYMVQIGLPDDVIKKISRYFYIKQPRTDYKRNNYNQWVQVKVLQQAKKEKMSFPRIETLYLNNWITGASLLDYEMYNKQVYHNFYDLDKISSKLQPMDKIKPIQISPNIV